MTAAEQTSNLGTPPTPPPGENQPATPPGNVEGHAETVDKQFNAQEQHNHFGEQNYFGQHPKEEVPLTSLREDLPKELPPGLHEFRDPDHQKLLDTLTKRHIVVLASYKDEAAYAAGHALVYDPAFDKNKRRTLFLTRQRDKHRSDLDLMGVTQDDLLQEPQIFLIGIRNRCVFFESVLNAEHQTLRNVSDTLIKHGSYLVVSVDEKLFGKTAVTDQISGLYTHSVSHFRYLLTVPYGDRAAKMEQRLCAALGSLAIPEERRDRYHEVAAYLADGSATFERFLERLEADLELAPEQRAASLRKIEPSVIFNESPQRQGDPKANETEGLSQIQRAVAFVAACLPDLNQKDFDRLVCLLLGDETITKETIRPAVRRDGKLVTIHDKIEERCVDRWHREADRIFRACYLRTIVSGDGSWAVDFSEPSLRTALRSYFDEQHPWYLRRQCERLQTSGILFYEDLSPKAVEGLVRLFVERAIGDPTGFGSLWLLRLVVSGRTERTGGSFAESADDMLAQLLEQLAKDHLRERFQERLSILIREMFDQVVLRPVVRRFFEHLLASRQHDAPLEIVLDLATRLRFVPDFDPLIWMRRLLDEGSEAVRERTLIRLTDMARHSGPKIYEFLEDIHAWLPAADRTPDEYSFSNLVALEFPFVYCAEMAKWVEPGLWPSQHPLFYALPGNQQEAKRMIAPLVEWIVDTRGAMLEKADGSDPLKSPEVVRIGYVADLIEHWLWVLEGPPAITPPVEGASLFTGILEELNARLSPRQRTWLQRKWQQSQDKLMSDAAKSSTDDRKTFVARKTKLEQLRMRFATLVNAQRTRFEGEPAS